MTSLKPHARIIWDGHQMETKEQDFAFWFSDDIAEWIKSRQLRRNKAIAECAKANREKKTGKNVVGMEGKV